MDDATQKRHRENAAENVRRGFGRVAYLPSSETVELLDALEAAQRPPVSSEAREEMKSVLHEAMHKGAYSLGEQLDDLIDALLARFSVPSQPVYDEEAIACVLWDAAEVTEDTGRDRHLWENVSKDVADWWRAVAAALVAALRGGELTREETNRG